MSKHLCGGCGKYWESRHLLVCPSCDVTGPQPGIRGVAIAFNAMSEYINRKFHLNLELINVGEQPGDCTGDTMEDATAKVLRNNEMMRYWLDQQKRGEQ